MIDEVPEKHPIQEHPEWIPEKRLRILEIYLAKLWDQVWWLSLTPEKRAQYEAAGFTQPIDRFYESK